MKLRNFHNYTFLIFSLLLFSCVTNNSLHNRSPKSIKLQVLEGKYKIIIIGHISSDQKYKASYPDNKNNTNSGKYEWTIPEGSKTIDKVIYLNSGDEFNYTLQSS